MFVLFQTLFFSFILVVAKGGGVHPNDFNRVFYEDQITDRLLAFTPKFQVVLRAKAKPPSDSAAADGTDTKKGIVSTAAAEDESRHKSEAIDRGSKCVLNVKKIMLPDAGKTGVYRVRAAPITR